MIYALTMYAAKCDNCGRTWSNYDGIMAYMDESQMSEQLMNDEWEEGQDGEKNKHYCPDCYYHDDEDNFCLKNKYEQNNNNS